MLFLTHSQWRAIIWLMTVAFVLVPSSHATAQDPMRGSGPGSSGANCRPATAQDNEQTQQVGCWIVASEPQGAMPKPRVFWNIYSYPTRAAADAVKGEHEAVIDGLGKTWLFAIGDSGAARSSGVAPVASVGPVEVKPGVEYTARYMVAVFKPGMTTPVHVHSGPEAWYTLSGEVCLETPSGRVVGRSGQSTVIPAGPPMKLTATGVEIRRSLVLVLHESAKPAGTTVSYWTPKGLCR